MRFTAFLLGGLAALFGAFLHAVFIANSLPIFSALSSHLSSYKSAVPAAASYTNNPQQTSHQSTTMAATKSFLDAVKERRTFYQLNNESPISDDKIEQIVNDVVLSVPSSFNSQSTRLVVLLKKEHEKFWDITKDVLKPQVPADAFPATEAKLNGFRGAYGTVSAINSPIALFPTPPNCKASPR